MAPDTRFGDLRRTTAANPDAQRPTTARLLQGQVAHALRGVARNPMVAVIALLLPMAFLVLLGLLARDAGTDPVTGATAIQLTAPTAAIFAAVMAAFVLLPAQFAQAAERGVLTRLRGTPLPMGVHVAGQVVAAVLVALAGTALLLLVAVGFFGLRLPPRVLPALLVTLLVGIACWAALGFAAAAVLRRSETVMTVTVGSFLLLAFTSGFFGVGLQLPRLLDVTTWWFPLRHMDAAVRGLFLPGAAAGDLPWEHLAVLALWGAAGAAVAARALTRGERTRGVRQRRAHRRVEVAAAGTSRTPEARPWLRRLAMTGAVLRHSNRALLRQPTGAFFSVAFPVLFVVVVPYAFGNPVIDGVPIAELVTPAMAVFGMVVTSFVNLPENVALARERGVLMRLRGTPLPTSAYLLGRLGSAGAVGALAAVGAFVAGWVVHGVSPPWRAVPALVLAGLVGIVAFTAMGFALVAVLPTASAVSAVALGLFLPLGFVSDLLSFGMPMPPVLDTVGWIFPLKHLSHAVSGAFASGAVEVVHLAAVLAWGALGAVVAGRRFRWQRP